MNDVMCGEQCYQMGLFWRMKHVLYLYNEHEAFMANGAGSMRP